MYEKDRRIVITLDAGGTNFVFGAVQGDRFVVEPITLPSNSDRLDRCLETMVEGFRTVISRLPEQPAAISFAFPGPADYPRGIIGGYLPNFPSFRDGVALKDFLEERFGIPTFINNDGDLYAYGEALAGALPEINARLEAAGSAKRFRNLIGYTWGTGFGVGIVSDNRLHIGDNSCVETFCLRHKDLPDINVEEGVSIRAVNGSMPSMRASTTIRSIRRPFSRSPRASVRATPMRRGALSRGSARWQATPWPPP